MDALCGQRQQCGQGRDQCLAFECNQVTGQLLASEGIHTATDNDAAKLAEVLGIHTQVKMARIVCDRGGFALIPFAITVFVIEHLGARDVAVNGFATQAHVTLVDGVAVRIRLRGNVARCIVHFDAGSDHGD